MPTLDNTLSKSSEEDSLLWIVTSPASPLENESLSSEDTSHEWCTKSVDVPCNLPSDGLYTRWISDGAIMVSREERTRESVYKRWAVQNHCLWSRRSFWASSTSTEVKKVKYSTHQKVTIFCLCLVNFTSFLSMSIIAPFFPKEAAQKGMREAVSGFVFSIYALIMMLTSPFFGKLLPKCGAKFLFLAGVLMAGVCNVLFGFLDQIDNADTFTALCFIVRIFEAVGAASFATATYTFVMEMFPDDIGTIFGVLETFIGLGSSLGPAIGGALYTLGGYGLPFFTLGTFVILTIPVSWYLLPTMDERDSFEESTSDDASYFRLLTLPKVAVVCIALIISSQTQGFLDPTLEPHMRQFNVGAGIVGLLFLLLSAAYAIFSPITGWLSNRLSNQYLLMCIGLGAMSVAMFSLGPAPFMPFRGSLDLSIVCLLVMGVSFAFAFVPTFEAIFLAALAGGFEDNLGTYSMVSGLWNSMYALGEVTGPSLGGLLSDFFSFQWAATLIGAFSSFAFVLVLLLCLFGGRKYIRRRKVLDAPFASPLTTSEKSPLLKTRSNGNI